MTRSTEQGVQVFDHGAIPLTGTNKDQLQFGNWTSPNQGIPLIVTRNGQQSTQTLANQATQSEVAPRSNRSRVIGGPPGSRTPHLGIKSPLLYRMS
jgi:hypothetical protein